MNKVGMLALGALLAAGALAPQQAAAQSSGRQRAQGRGGVIVPDNRNGGVIVQDGSCYDQSTYNRRRGDDDEDRYENEGHGHGKHQKADKRRDGEDDDRYENDGNYRGNNCDQVYNQTSNGRRGPKFCRNGQGHPVYGMAWCRQKGFGSNSGSLINTGWGDVILRRPRYDTRGNLSSSVLSQVLGRVVLGRFDAQRYRLGINQPLVGQWLDTQNGSVLNLFAGGVEIGRILDRNGDGRADVVLLNGGR